MRVHAVADRKWRTLKFRFFVTRDIIFIFLAVQLVSFMFSIQFIAKPIYVIAVDYFMYNIFYSLFIFMQVIASLGYLTYFIDGCQHYWLRLTWGFDSKISFYYICGKISIS